MWVAATLQIFCKIARVAKANRREGGFVAIDRGRAVTGFTPPLSCKDARTIGKVAPSRRAYLRITRKRAALPNDGTCETET